MCLQIGRFVLILVFFGVSPQSMAGALVDHFKHAIELNSERLPLYSKLTDGVSESLSRRLIRAERVSLLAAKVTEWRLRKYMKSGIDYFSFAMVDISETPDFLERFPNGAPSIQDFRSIDIDSIRDGLRPLIEDEDYVSISDYTNSLLTQIEEPHEFNCMIRHVVESLRRAAQSAPYALGLSEEKGMSSKRLKKTIRVYLKSHLLILKESNEIDVQASGFQAMGIPMICNDVPKIPSFEPPKD